MIRQVDSLAEVQVNSTLVLKLATSNQLPTVHKLAVEEKELPELFTARADLRHCSTVYQDAGPVEDVLASPVLEEDEDTITEST